MLALLAAVAAVTCAKAEDQTTPGNSGAGGSNGAGSTTTAGMGTAVQNTTTVSTVSGTNGSTATSSASQSSASTSTSTSTTGGGNQGGEAGAPSETTGSDGGSGTGGSGTDGSVSTTGVPPDVIENASVVLLYKIDSSTATTASIFMHLYLRNQSDDAFPLGAAEVRYWLDPDGRGYTLASHYQGPGIGDVTLSKGSSGDDDYVSVTFEEGETLAANTGDINPNEFQLKLDASGGNFDQSDDYSFEPTYTTPTEHDRITVYLADELIWGCEPSGACAGDDPGAGGAGGAAGAAGAEG